MVARLKTIGHPASFIRLRDPLSYDLTRTVAMGQPELLGFSRFPNDQEFLFLVVKGGALQYPLSQSKDNFLRLSGFQNRRVRRVAADILRILCGLPVLFARIG